MSGKHNSYEQIARTRRGSAGYREGYDEARRVVPTLPLLDRIAAALDADLTVTLPPRRLSTATVGAVPPERHLANSGGTCPTRWRRGTSTYREVTLKSAAVAGR